ncbi:MAG: hypothetical protein KDB88_03985 [Flavobacteriales bacterium]|nr:hypothetical protein [Flavobacteriales bacterium]
MDSIDRETTMHLDMLERDPSMASVVLPRLQRLRDLKQSSLDHVDALRTESSRTEVIAANAPMEAPAARTGEGPGTVPTAASSVRAAPMVASPSARYIVPETRPDRTYHSAFAHRSKEIAEAVQLRDQDLQRIDALQHDIDSLQAVLDTMPRGKAYDKIEKERYRYLDDQLIVRTELGQRSEFIVKQEIKAARDSMKVVKALVDAKGLPRTEPVLVMAERAESEATKLHSDAALVRKQADRTEDILVRDSLFRRAYAMELVALSEQDKALTLRNYTLSEDFERGGTPTYAEVEQRMFGAALGEELLAEEQGVLRTGEGAADLASNDATTTDVAPGAVNTAALFGVGTAPDGRPRFDRFMGADTTGMSNLAKLAMADPAVLRTEAEAVMTASQQLERRSLYLADRAIAIQDSSATVKKRDREQLELQAVRTRQLSDSLHEASLSLAENARTLEQQERDAQEAREFADRLREYYYLSNEEFMLVMQNEDESRYFQAKVKAIEQDEAAAKAASEAKASKALSEQMLLGAQAAMTIPPGEDRSQSGEELAKAAELNAKAVELDQRSDSLSALAQRLKGASSLNDGQASLYLQSLGAQRSSEIMAMEQRTRRVEPMLAEARALAPAGANVAEGGEADDGREEVDAAGDVAQESADAPDAARLADESSTVRSGMPDRAETQGGVDHQPWDFPMPEELVDDLFEILPVAKVREAPIPIDVDIPQGLVFKVQIGAFRNPIPQQLFSDMSPVMGENAGNGLVRYTAGLFKTFEVADGAKASVRERGYRDAFVVAYLNGERISMAEARKLQGATTSKAAIAQNSDGRGAAGNAVPGASTQGAPSATTSGAPSPGTGPVVIARPSTVAATNSAQEQETLASYPSTAEELMSTFAPQPEAAAYYNDPTAAPAKQVEVVKGLFFTVQVGVYSKPVALDQLYNITPLNTELIQGGKIRYTTGVYRDLEEARVRKDASVSSGVRDAFITAYLNGKRIPVQEARALLNKFGDQVLVSVEDTTD